VSFSVSDVALQNQFLVSEAIGEIVLGSDWLDANKCTWDLEMSMMSIKSLPTPVSVRLCSSLHSELLRRIYATEDVELPANSKSAVPVTSGRPFCRGPLDGSSNLRN